MKSVKCRLLNHDNNIQQEGEAMNEHTRGPLLGQGLPPRGSDTFGDGNQTNAPLHFTPWLLSILCLTVVLTLF